MFKTSRKAFTLIELLVVIAIIGMLVSMLLPAVQQARESARIMTCDNHLKQMGLAVMNFESQHKMFPSAGWVHHFGGDADLGVGKKQCGGWPFSLLPFLEQNQLYMMTSNNDPLNANRDGITRSLQVPLSVFYCPSRRDTQLYPGVSTPHINANPLTEVAKCDYGANFGELLYGAVFDNIRSAYPGSYNDANTWTANKTWPAPVANGVVFNWSEISMGMIQDGTSNTFLIGEKYLSPDYYEGSFWADDNGIFAGFDPDHSRGVRRDNETLLPMQDRRGYDNAGEAFGSVHSSSFGMAMCDGSVQRIGYEIDVVTFANLGNRCDGNSASLPQ